MKKSKHRSKNYIFETVRMPRFIFALTIIVAASVGGYSVWMTMASSQVNCKSPATNRLNYCVNDSDESKIARLYYGTFGRSPSRKDVEYWTHKLRGTNKQSKWSLQQTAKYFITSREFTRKNGSSSSLSDKRFIGAIYRRIFGRNATSADLSFWTRQLSNGKTRATVLTSMTESAEAKRKYQLGVASTLGFRQQWINRPAEVRKTYSIVLVAGQSNAVGNEAYTAGNPYFNDNHPSYGSYWLSFKNYAPNDQLTPVNNLRTRQNESSGKQISGPELGLARTLYEKGKRDVVLVKVAEGGTPLHARDGKDWNVASKNENYSDLVKQAKTAFKWVEDRGATYTVEGLIWMQGETDTVYTKGAENYYTNLDIFWTSVKKNLRLPTDTPMIIGKIDLSRHWAVRKKAGNCAPSNRTTCQIELRNTELVRNAQQRYANAKPDVHIIPTGDLPVVAGHQIHFTTKGQILLGKRFADTLLRVW